MSRRSEQLSLFAALNKAGADYVVVGGVAVNAHGFIRNTSDLDLYLRPTVDNAVAVFHALEGLAVPLDGKEPTELLMDYSHFQLQTLHGRVDFLTSIGGTPFDQVWSGRVQEEIEGVLVPFISKGDLIANKLQVGRTRDLLDAEELALLPNQEHLQLVDETHDEAADARPRYD